MDGDLVRNLLYSIYRLYFFYYGESIFSFTKLYLITYNTHTRTFEAVPLEVADSADLARQAALGPAHGAGGGALARLVTVLGHKGLRQLHTHTHTHTEEYFIELPTNMSV